MGPDGIPMAPASGAVGVVGGAGLFAGLQWKCRSSQVYMICEAY